MTVTVAQELGDFVLIPTSAIEVGERYRKQPEKELENLVESINTLGLLNPVVVLTPNENGKHLLIAGQRRLMAVEKLGMDEIEAHVVHDLDEANQLRAEHDENVCRVPMVASEIRALVKARLAVEQEAARQAQVEGGREGAKVTNERKRNPKPEGEEAERVTANGRKAKPRNKTALEKSTEGTGISRKTLERQQKIEGYRDNPEMPDHIRGLAAQMLDAIDAKSIGTDTALQNVERALHKWEREQARPEEEETVALVETPEGTIEQTTVAEVKAESRGQTKALNAAMAALRLAAEQLEKAFTDAENLDPDTNVDSIKASFTDIRKLVSRINKVVKDVKELTE